MKNSIRDDTIMSKLLGRERYTIIPSELLISREILRKPGINVAQIAQNIRMSKQNVSARLLQMKKAGLVDLDGEIRGSYVLTITGVEWLTDRLSEMERFVEDTAQELERIESCVAIAKTKIIEGNEVGLFMEKGILYAFQGRKSHSQGTAAHNAEVGDPLHVRDLRGIVDHQPGRLYILEIPKPQNIKDSSMIISEISRSISDISPDRVCVLGISSQALVKQLNLTIPILELVPVESTLSAIHKGLDVVVLGTSSELNPALAFWQENNVISASVLTLSSTGQASD